ncbi:transcription elongation factor GreA [Burkholderia diffusa]|uniref:transcription elongation factor GreA n=1 Tax=Burkholderia diffusa TaxID=488732 RepID=UPI000B006B99|nr:transcription elongation factor GreA [Burkholderia diffusa]
MDYPNVPPSIAFVANSGLATLAELQTIYGVEDLWDLIEMHAVHCFNLSQAQHAQRH